jgi:lysophospholipase L1-like esterase
MKKGWGKTLLINLLVLAALLVVIEIVSRVVLHKVYNRSFDSSLIVDNVFGSSSGMRKNAEGHVWGKTLHTDEDGWRKVKNRQPRKNKWLFIGDSVTEGVGVDDSSTFASLCSEQFTDFNVHNCALIGYSTSDYVNVLNTALQDDSAAVELVTVFFCLNDIYGQKKSKDDLPAIARRGWMSRINGLLQDRYATYKLIKLWFYKNSDRYFTYDLQFYQPGNERFIAAMHNLQTCDSVCKANGIYFNVVVLPYQSQLSSKNFTPQRLINQFCKEKGIDCSDAAENLQKQPDYADLYLFADEIHFSEKGHRAIADFLSE